MMIRSKEQETVSEFAWNNEAFRAGIGVGKTTGLLQQMLNRTRRFPQPESKGRMPPRGRATGEIFTQAKRPSGLFFTIKLDQADLKHLRNAFRGCSLSDVKGIPDTLRYQREPKAVVHAYRPKPDSHHFEDALGYAVAAMDVMTLSFKPKATLPPQGRATSEIFTQAKQPDEIPFFKDVFVAWGSTQTTKEAILWNV